jgi:hypothetical protein
MVALSKRIGATIALPILLRSFKRHSCIWFVSFNQLTPLILCDCMWLECQWADSARGNLSCATRRSLRRLCRFAAAAMLQTFSASSIFQFGCFTALMTKSSKSIGLVHWVDSLNALGAPVRYTEFPNVGHNAWSPAFATDELYDWLFSQKKR